VQVQSELDVYGDACISVVGISFSSDDKTTVIKDDLKLDFPIVSDSNKLWYKVFQDRRVGFRSLFSARIWLIGMRALLSGRRQHKSDEDVWQLGADLLLDGNKVVRCWASSRLEDRPGVGEIVMESNRYQNK